MPSEEKKALVRRFYEAHLKGDLDAMREIMAPDFADRSLFPGEEGSDREAYIRGVAEDRAAISVLRLTIDDQIAEGDKVVTRYTERSVRRGEFLGVAPTGKEESSTGIDIHRIAGDKIAEEWSESSSVNIVVPALEQETQNRERIEQELQVARRIQQASLPKEVPELGGWQISPLYRPAREVGGDFYDFHLLSEGKIGLVVGDATGKGVPAALVMSTTCGMLRLAAQNYSSPGEMLQRVNEALFPNIPPNMFVTCFYAILDPESGSLRYANAGHDLPYVHRGGGDAEELRARGMPLGLMPGMGYEEKQTILQAGEAALFYSDGLVEAHDLKGEMFGFPRLRTLIAEHGDEEGSLGDFLLEELYSFIGEGWEQEDDITLLTLQRSATRG
jgi:serine phosphatase RsbU (regulator of sigma subunit)/ketosteroid isomerase-like protein